MPELPSNPDQTITPFDRVYATPPYTKPTVESHPNILADDVRDQVRLVVQRSASEREAEIRKNNISQEPLELSQKTSKEMLAKTLLKEIESAKRILGILENTFAAKKNHQTDHIDELQRELFAALGGIENIDPAHQMTLANRRTREAIYRGLRATTILCDRQYLKSPWVADMQNLEKKLRPAIKWDAPKNPHELTEIDIHSLYNIFNSLEQYVPRI